MKRIHQEPRHIHTHIRYLLFWFDDWMSTDVLCSCLRNCRYLWFLYFILSPLPSLCLYMKTWFVDHIATYVFQLDRTNIRTWSIMDMESESAPSPPEVIQSCPFHLLLENNHIGSTIACNIPQSSGLDDLWIVRPCRCLISTKPTRSCQLWMIKSLIGRSFQSLLTA